MCHFKREKTLLFVGATNSGKTTFLNGFNKSITIKPTEDYNKHFFKKNNTLFTVFDTVENSLDLKDNIDININMLYAVEEAVTIDHIFFTVKETEDFRRKMLFYFIDFFNVLFKENTLMNPLKSLTHIDLNDVVTHIQDIFSIVITRDKNTNCADIVFQELSAYIYSETGVKIPRQRIYYEDDLKDRIFTNTYDKSISFKFYHGMHASQMQYIKDMGRLNARFNEESETNKKKFIKCQILLEQSKHRETMSGGLYRYLLALPFKSTMYYK